MRWIAYLPPLSHRQTTRKGIPGRNLWGITETMGKWKWDTAKTVRETKSKKCLIIKQQTMELLNRKGKSKRKQGIYNHT